MLLCPPGLAHVGQLPTGKGGAFKKQVGASFHDPVGFCQQPGALPSVMGLLLFNSTMKSGKFMMDSPSSLFIYGTPEPGLAAPGPAVYLLQCTKEITKCNVRCQETTFTE